MRANDAIVGAVLIVAALAMIAFTATFPDFPGQKYGPALFPRILGVGIVICGLLLIVSGLAGRRAGGAWVAFSPWAREPAQAAGWLLVIGLLLAYILISDIVGFILVAVVLLGLLMYWLGVRPLPAAATAVVATIAMQWFFGSLLRVPLPRGWLTDLM